MITTEARIDEFKAYRKINLTQLQDMIPAIDWKRFFSKPFLEVNYTITDEETIGLFSAEYFKELSSLLFEYNSTSDKRELVIDWVNFSFN